MNGKLWNKALCTGNFRSHKTKLNVVTVWNQGEYFYLFSNIHYGIVLCAGGKVLILWKRLANFTLESTPKQFKKFSFHQFSKHNLISFSNSWFMIVLHTFENLLTICKPCKDNEYLTMTPLIIQLIYEIVTISGVRNILSREVWLLSTPNVWKSLFSNLRNSD